MAAILLQRLFDDDPITTEKLERIKAELGISSGRFVKYTLKPLFEKLFQFPEFTLEKLIRLVDSKILEETWMDEFLMSAIQNLRESAMIEYLKNLPIPHRHSPLQMIGNKNTEAVFKLYRSFFPIPENIISQLPLISDQELYRLQIEFLQSQGFDINTLYDGETVLTRLFEYHSCDDLRGPLITLINLGADVNLPNSEGHTPLHLAYSRRLLDWANLLLAHGANPT